MTKATFYSKDGTKLIGIWCLPKVKTDKAVILAHGITVDKDEDGIFVELADLLEKNGFAVFRFDFRGHGESGGKSVDMTIQGEIDDLACAVDEVKNKGYKNIGLLGASFGGGIAVLYATENQERLRCLCLWNPCLDYDHCFLKPSLPWLKDTAEKMRKDLKEKDWTTLGSRKMVLGKKLFEEMARFYPHKEIRKIKLPFLILHGDKDTYVPLEDSEKSVQGMRNAKLIIISGGEHGFHEPEEVTRKAVSKTLEFFRKHL